MTQIDYPYIRAWHAVTGGRSYSEYTESVVKRAIEDKAPATTIFYRSSEERWVTFGEIKSSGTKALVALAVEKATP